MMYNKEYIYVLIIQDDIGTEISTYKNIEKAEKVFIEQLDDFLYEAGIAKEDVKDIEGLGRTYDECIKERVFSYGEYKFEIERSLLHV